MLKNITQLSTLYSIYRKNIPVHFKNVKYQFRRRKMEEIAIYGVLWAIAVGFVVLFTRYLISLRKAREENLTLAEPEETPKQELKLEVVKAAPPEKPVKVAKKKTAAKKTAAKKTTKKKATSAPPADNP